jgi:Holliday junction DNA helicase RuvB
MSPPSNWHGFVGQRHAVVPLRRLARGAKALGSTVGPVLFTGASGLGKTELAKIFTRELGREFRRLICHPETGPIDLAMFIQSWAPGDVVFFDEAQALRPGVQERLFEIIDSRRGPSVLVDPLQRRFLGPDIDVPAVCLFVATDRPSKLLVPLKRRLSVAIELRPYAPHEMRTILRQRAAEKNIVLSPQAAKALVPSCRGMPRAAGQRLETLIQFHGERPLKEFTRGHVRNFLTKLGIDQRGFERSDRAYLKILAERNGAPASLKLIAAKMMADAAAVAQEIETFLLREGLIEIGTGGRTLTANGREIANSMEIKK